MLVETMYGRTDESPSDEKGYTFPLARAVRDRQTGRIPAGLRAASETLNRIEGAYQMARAEAFPSTETLTTATGALLRRAAK
jgi:hypothetical protein